MLASAAAGVLLVSLIVSKIASAVEDTVREASCDGTLQHSPDGWLTLAPPPGEEGTCAIPPALAARVLRTCQVGAAMHRYRQHPPVS